jgi:S-adenosylmethionine hydrolase
MGIITLTTDLGYKDFYQAALKGSILNTLPNVTIIDISHEIEAFNISKAAFLLKNSFYYFPKSTVHLIGIDTVYSASNKYLGVKYRDHYFVGADNGIFSLIFEEEPQEIVELNILQDLKFLHFPLADIFVKAACHLADGGELLEIGDAVDEVEERINFNPVIVGNSIKGNVIFIDSFENVITNVTKDLFTKVQNGRNFSLSFKRNEKINQLSWHYDEVPVGEKLCLFGISNHLEIAINKGNASGLLGLKANDMIQIDFR